MARAIPKIEIDLDMLNHTELVLLAQWCGLPASRAMPRDVLVESLETFTPTEIPVPFDDKRKQLSEWQKRWWHVIRMQVPKKACPNCHLCRDIQVLDCYLHNERSIKPGPSRTQRRK